MCHQDTSRDSIGHHLTSADSLRRRPGSVDVQHRRPGASEHAGHLEQTRSSVAPSTPLGAADDGCLGHFEGGRELVKILVTDRSRVTGDLLGERPQLGNPSLAVVRDGCDVSVHHSDRSLSRLGRSGVLPSALPAHLRTPLRHSAGALHDDRLLAPAALDRLAGYPPTRRQQPGGGIAHQGHRRRGGRGLFNSDVALMSDPIRGTTTLSFSLQTLPLIRSSAHATPARFSDVSPVTTQPTTFRHDRTGTDP